MVTSIGSASPAQAPLAQAGKTRTEEAPAQTVAPGATSDGTAAQSSAETQSALSSATARVGDELHAQADASRVQRAVDEAAASTQEQSGSTEDSTAAAAPRGGARGGGGMPAAGETESADYIAEADTNSDKKVSDQERAAYEKKLAQQVQAYNTVTPGEGASLSLLA